MRRRLVMEICLHDQGTTCQPGVAAQVTSAQPNIDIPGLDRGLGPEFSSGYVNHNVIGVNQTSLGMILEDPHTALNETRVKVIVTVQHANETRFVRGQQQRSVLGKGHAVICFVVSSTNRGAISV